MFHMPHTTYIYTIICPTVFSINLGYVCERYLDMYWDFVLVSSHSIRYVRRNVNLDELDNRYMTQQRSCLICTSKKHTKIVSAGLYISYCFLKSYNIYLLQPKKILTSLNLCRGFISTNKSVTRRKKNPAGMFSAYDSTQHPGSLIVFTITGRAKSPCMD